MSITPIGGIISGLFYVAITSCIVTKCSNRFKLRFGCKSDAASRVQAFFRLCGFIPKGKILETYWLAGQVARNFICYFKLTLNDLSAKERKALQIYVIILNMLNLMTMVPTCLSANSSPRRLKTIRYSVNIFISGICIAESMFYKDQMGSIRLIAM